MLILTFINDFNIYYNSYYTLTSFYYTPISLFKNNHTHKANVFLIALGPHSLDFKDIIKALKSIQYLNKGITAYINGNKIRIYIFNIYFTNNMP